MTLLYLSYGSGPHEAEVGFSILTAVHQGLPDSCRCRIFTDHPERFRGLPADVVNITPEEWTEWSGPHRFAHRRKILALRRALAEADGDKVVLLDGDTWWRRSPTHLAERIGPGRAVLHILEGRIDAICTPQSQSLAAFLASGPFATADGSRLAITPDTPMWNAGVIGLDAADAGLLDEVLEMTDGLLAHGRFHVLEQLAFSRVLAARTSLRAADDIVFHYWPPYLHRPFREQVVGWMETSASWPLAERAAWCHARRPRPTPLRRVKVVAKRCLQAFGLLRGRARSNEW